MKIKKEKALWILYGGILILLFLLSSTDLIIKEKKSEVYPISVIIEDARDDYYVNFRKGMDRAALDLNADVSFITLYESGSQKQQTDLMLREQQDGARALIVSPVSDQALSQLLTENRLTGPLILLNSRLTGERIASGISPDYYAMGQMLGQAAVREQPRDLPVYLFAEKKPEGVTAQIYDGVCAALQEAGRLWTLHIRQQEDTFQTVVERLTDPGSINAVIIALDPGSLSETAAVLEDNRACAACVNGLYGRGTTIPILNYLDKGVITGICVTDDFSAGYLSVRKAVEAVKLRTGQDRVTLESYYIRKEDIRKKEYEAMLYPIE